MAGPAKREIRAQDVQGLKGLRPRQGPQAPAPLEEIAAELS